MKSRREALQNLIDKEQEAAAKAQARGQWKAAARHLLQADRYMRLYDEARPY